MRFIKITTFAASLLCASAFAQTSVTTIAPGTFGDKHYKAPVANESALPLTGNSIVDQRRVLDTGAEYWWNGFAWIHDQSSQGSDGLPGEPGTAATVVVGSVSTLSPGSSATVVNSGSSQAAIFDFGIPRGLTGTTGAAGINGKTVLGGTGAPSSGLGVDGDFYIDTSVTSIYGPKVSGSWGSATSLIGPGGATGGIGSTGASGATWLSGSGIPSGGVGVNGDFYFRTATGDVYLKSGGMWSVVANITGPTGPIGPSGATGATGSTGATGATGPAGVVTANSPLSLVSATLSIGAFPAGSGAACSSGLRFGSSSCWWEVSSGDAVFATGGKNIFELNYAGNTSAWFQTLQAPNVKLDPSQNPPFTCDSSKQGVMYFDANTTSFCGCTGSAWLPFLGTGPCA